MQWLALPDVRAALAVDADVVAIDMPIGLPDTGRRACDLQAKRLLGAAHPRVFLAPPRGVLDCPDHPTASARHRELAGGAGLSIQTWHIVDRMREVDDAADDPRLVEVHPELSFAALAGRVLDRKRTAAGRAERLAALRTWLPGLDLGVGAVRVTTPRTRWPRPGRGGAGWTGARGCSPTGSRHGTPAAARCGS